ncbi:DUF3800 domain-containing protein [Candidatus Desantisbacteria bacterium CG07_land_8_20_14_0_80_39_15]|uniref:DUF3800 domain-containing protein n=1 Tax=Candidatus Desantisbacteria bacterium CG07_land_8_20_14_0_80_39_15 TaxID=1974549 RepID=A0A2M6ZIC7_9BACT|nr:MAG: DUF3800 domain-containing protein [Candidatus Desantisbacteria bacterium CG07_land_8_20_14_0_80_39_15]
MNNKNNIQQIEHNVYCDESCHLEHDHQSVMLIGAIWCPKSETKKISDDIRKIKVKKNARGELKWIKVSKSRQNFYIDLVNYFFKTPALHFRCVVIRDKPKLNHDYFNQGSHDTFYYKMYFSMLKTILNPQNKYNIYLDIKDTRSQNKVVKLKEVLCNNVFDFTREMIANIQHIRSNELELLQLADLFIGAVSYRNRDLGENQAKVAVVERIEKEIKQSLCSPTSLFNEKFNLFIFSPSEVENE